MKNAAARETDPQTAHDAARGIESKASRLEGMVLSVLRRNKGGLTGQEVTDKLGLDRVTTSPRFAPLRRKGLIEDSGRKRTSPGGRSAIVWRATR